GQWPRGALRLAYEIIDAAKPVSTLLAPVIDRLAGACLTLIYRPDITPGTAYSPPARLLSRLCPLPSPGWLAISKSHLTVPLQVEYLATIAEMSRGHFVRQFSLATGTAPSDYVLARRIDRIERLLLATDMSVSVITAATSFADANYLAKAFRRKRSMAPLVFRTSQRLAVGA
ncbi:MAG: helix-turn-helix transcriptional regulator, partial [Candidatus Devosia symbiotica]|nr:helix-turn-helix transcriptional regulator [Candidatus Devosia symbiotica]